MDPGCGLILSPQTMMCQLRADVITRARRRERLAGAFRALPRPLLLCLCRLYAGVQKHLQL
jgi:hypothetical protein